MKVRLYQIELQIKTSNVQKQKTTAAKTVAVWKFFRKIVDYEMDILFLDTFNSFH